MTSASTSTPTSISISISIFKTNSFLLNMLRVKWLLLLILICCWKTQFVNGLGTIVYAPLGQD